MTPIKRVWVDQSTCIANRVCMLLETNVFLENADDYVPAIAEDAAKYFESHRRQIIWSVLNCPVGAIHLQFADGKEISSYEFDAMSVEDWTNY